MKTADQAPNQRHNNNHGGKVQNVSTAAVRALISELEIFRIKKLEQDTATDADPVNVNIGFADHYYNETQQLGSVCKTLIRFEAELANIAFKIQNPMRRAALAYAIEIARAIEPLNLERRWNFSSEGNLEMPRLEAPARFNVWPDTRSGSFDFISRVLYENFGDIARRLEKMPPYIAAEIAGALHIAHEVHRARVPKARDLKSADILKEQLGRWADENFRSARAQQILNEVAAEKLQMTPDASINKA